MNEQTRLQAQSLLHALCPAQDFVVSGHRNSDLAMAAEFSV